MLWSSVLVLASKRHLRPLQLNVNAAVGAIGGVGVAVVGGDVGVRVGVVVGVAVGGGDVGA
jgi:hypothetical protein